MDRFKRARVDAEVAAEDRDAVKESRELVAELCRHFYTLGWVSGTGGSISMKINSDKPIEQRPIVMAPSGVQKERMLPEDMYVLDTDGSVLEEPTVKPPPHKPPKCSECGPLFLKCYEMHNAGAVIHSHGIECVLATLLKPGDTEFRISHMEMIKGIQGHGYYDELVVPIIENTAREYELTDSLAAAIAAYPKATAVLVRNHGIYVWGTSWIHAKTQAECYHYLFDAAVKMHNMGLSLTDPLHAPLHKQHLHHHHHRTHLDHDQGPPKAGANGAADENGEAEQYKPAAIVLDIEGTTTPISFVADKLFPYARAHAADHLLATYDTAETQGDIALLRKQIGKDVEAGVEGAVPVPPADAGKEAVVSTLAQNIAAMIKADRKVTALKQLQGHIWRVGYEKGELKGEFFSDVLTALAQWTAVGIKVYIYSSGSREAQRLIFGYSNLGDLRSYISAYFDTTTGNKRGSRSYSEIFLSVGVDSPSEIVFCTDILAEAAAAKDAGLKAVLLSRPGNAAVPEGHGFGVAKSLVEVLHLLRPEAQ